MNELTIWDNNPREMWVWDYNLEAKERARVVYLCDVDKVEYPVITLSEGVRKNLMVKVFKHCAEIKEPKIRRMTNQELAWWLLDGIKEGKHREYIFSDTKTRIIRTTFDYCEETASDEICVNILIRENGGEWKEPLVDVEE